MKRQIRRILLIIMPLLLIFVSARVIPVKGQKEGNIPSPTTLTVEDTSKNTVPQQIQLEGSFKQNNFIPAAPVAILASSTFAIGQNFPGSNFNQSGFIPPDTMGAVGPSHIVELLNGRYAVYDKSGTLLQASSLNAFWSSAGVTPAGSFAFDPRIVYDKHSGRWFALSVDNGGGANNFLVAVSVDSDPTNGWTGFSIDADIDNLEWADFPMLGVNQEVVVVSANMFPIISGVSSTTFLVLPKSDLTTATPTVANGTIFENVNPNNTGFATQPVFDQDNNTLPLLLLSAYNKPAGFLKTSSIGGTALAPTLNTAGGFISVTPRGAPPDIDQPGLKVDIDAGDNRFSGNVVQQQIPGRTNTSLWGTHGVDIDGRAAIEWYEIDAVTNAILQSGTISDTSLAFNYPSIAVNDYGDVVISFSGGAPDTFMSTYVVVGDTDGGTTTFSAPQQIQTGVADYQRLDGIGRNRWGDYTATVVDPVNENHFWTFQEYVSATDVWQIQITEIIVSSSDFGDLPDTSSSTGAGDYQTTADNNGPSHIIVDTLSLGASTDADIDGQPSTGADGDDNNNADDEDGITIPASIPAGQSATFTATLTNTTGSDATLYGFIDWNSDGDFADSGEVMTQGVPNGAIGGSVNLNFSVPLTASVGSNLGARFRLSTDLGLNAEGAATNGEVEDYLIVVNPCETMTMHTITVDGSLTDWCSSTELLQNDVRPVIGTQDLYTTWDTINVYLAWDGSNWDSDGDMWLYFYSVSSAGTTTSVTGVHTLPPGTTGGGVDYALVITDTTNIQLYNWNGANWSDATFNGQVSASGNTVELAIPLADINVSSGEYIAYLAFAEVEGGDSSWASFPTSNPIGTAFAQAFQWQNTVSGVTPNDFSTTNGPTAVSLQALHALPPTNHALAITALLFLILLTFFSLRLRRR